MSVLWTQIFFFSFYLFDFLSVPNCSMPMAIRHSMFGKFQMPKRGEVEFKFRKLYQLRFTLIEIVRLLSDKKFSSVLKCLTYKV